MTTEFDQAQYWIERHINLRGKTTSVGKLGTDEEANKKAIPITQRKTKNMALLLYPRAEGISVLDLGCGVGRFTPSFLEAGYAYTGVDISPEAIDDAKKANPGAKYVVSNLLDYKSSAKFDLVYAAWVLCHFVKDEDWNRLLDSIASLTKKTGIFWLTDEMPVERKASEKHYLGRPLTEYKTQLEARGFTYRADLVDLIRTKMAASVTTNSAYFFERL